MSGLLSSLFGFATNSGIVPSIFNFAQSERQREWNEQQAQQANKWNIQNWQRQNAYNDPAAQMQRLRNAGINPALAFASGQVDNTASTPADAQMAREWLPYQIDPATSSVIDRNKAEAENLRSQIPVNEQKVNELKETVNKIKNEAKLLGIDVEIGELTKMGRANSINAGNKLSEEQAKEQLKYVKDTAKKTFDKLAQEVDNLKKDGLLKDKDYEIFQEKLRTARAEASVAEYKDLMKEWTYWLDYAIDFGGEIVDLISLIRGFPKIKKGG